MHHMLLLVACTALLTFMNIFLHLIATWWWTLQHISRSRFPWGNKQDLTFPGQHILRLSSVGNRWIDAIVFICIPTACVMMKWDSYVVGSSCRTADVRDLSSCHALSTAVLYDNRVFSMAPDGPCFHQPCRPFVKWFITFPVSILLEFNAAQRPAVTGAQCFVTKCCAALQGFSTDSCGMTLPFHGESHLFTLNCCCATFKFWDAW